MEQPLRVGIVGFGFMGRMHFANWNRCADTAVTAICEQNYELLNGLKKPVGNIAGAEQAVDLSNVQVYRYMDDMLKNEKLDVVCITLPTSLHAVTAMQCLKAGVHVLCEKPMALTSADCGAMIAAAREADRILVIAHCIRFWPEYAAAREIINSGRYGAVRAASFDRLGSTPKWSSGNWISDPTRSGGMILDLHIHDADFIQYLFGMPSAVCSHGTIQGNVITHVHTHYDYGDENSITAQGGWNASDTFGFEMSFKIMLEQATLVYNSNTKCPLTVYPSEGAFYCPELGEGDAYFREIAWFADLVRGNKPPLISTAEQSRDSVRLIEAESTSVFEQRRVTL